MNPAARPLRVTFLMLAHEHPELCARLAQRILDADGALVIHLDATCDDSFITRFDGALGPRAEDVHWADRVAVDWGDWSMVEATLSGLRRIAELPEAPDFVYLLSGADYPIRPLHQLTGFLERHRDRDFIEHKDAERERWIATGIQEERYRYRHWVSWRRHPRLFSFLLRLQERLGLRRRFPAGLQPHIGSQWWVLRWSTCQIALAWAQRPGIRRFFRTTNVPDELFFQSVVASTQPGNQVTDRHLTHYIFTDEGVPVVFHDGHGAYLQRQPFFFARKLSPFADQLRDTLDRALQGDQLEPPDDHRVGLATPDYEQFVERHRLGLQGRFCWGRVGETELGALERNERPYLVLVSPNDDALTAARGAVGATTSLETHGSLFGESQIDFGSDTGSGLAYGPGDVAIRDQDRPAFLADLIRAAAPRHLAFCLHRPADKAVGSTPETKRESTSETEPPVDLLRLLATDPNCRILYLAPRTDREALADDLRPRSKDGAVVARQARLAWVALPPAEAERFGNWEERVRRIGASLVRAPAPAHPEAATTTRPRLTLHIGIHRTGTTALQQFLHENRKALAKQGVHYAFEDINHNAFAAAMQQGGDAATEAITRLVENARDAGHPRIIVSAENLANLEDLAPLRALRETFDVEVVAYLRRQDRWLESWYNQVIRWPWNRESCRSTPEAFLPQARRFHWLDYARLYARWSEAFGEQRVVFRNYETGKHRLIEDFCETCSVDALHLERPPRSVNASASSLVTEALRHLDLIDRPRNERVAIINAVERVFSEQRWTGPRHVFSGAERRRILDGFAASNAQVARSMFERPDGVLFPGEPPEDDTERPDLSLPLPDALLPALAGTFVASWLHRLRGLDAHDGSSGESEARLFGLLLRQRALETRRGELDQPPEQRARQWVRRDRKHSGPLPAAVSEASPAVLDARSRLATALALEDRGPWAQVTLNTVLDRWQERLAETGAAPASGGQLLAEWFSPLADVLAMTLLARQRLDGLDDEARVREIETLRSEVDRLEAEVGRLESPRGRFRRLFSGDGAER